MTIDDNPHKKVKHALLCAVTMVLTVCVLTSVPLSDNEFSDAATPVIDGSCGAHMKYVLDSNGVLTLSGYGAIDDYSEISYGSSETTSAPWGKSYASSVKSVIIKDGITYVGTSSFEGCGSLTSVSIPDSVQAIGERAFEGCSSLVTVKIPSSVTSIGELTFRGCTSLESVVIPSSVTSIGNASFAACTSLTEITIPTSVTSLGQSVFSKCTSLASITIPSSVTYLGGYAFLNCTSLSSMHIPSSITSIEESTFKGCTSLSELSLPSTLTSIGWSAFEGCTSLPLAELPSSVTDIEDYAFYGCPSLKISTLPTSVINIGDYAFDGCTTLKQLEFLEISSIDDYAFHCCKGLESLTIRSPAEIGEHAFEGCTSLRYIYLEDVVSLGDYAFKKCDALTYLKIFPTITYMYESFHGLELYGADRSTLVSQTASDLPGYIYRGVGDGRLYREPLTVSLKFVIDGEAVEKTAVYGNAFMKYDISSDLSVFHGWYTDDTFTTPYDTLSDIGSDLVLYTFMAHVPSEPRVENYVEATRESDGSYDMVVRCSLCGEILSSEHFVIPRIDWIAKGVGTDGLPWILMEDGVLTVSGNGPMTDYACKGAPWYPHSSEIVAVVIGDGVTSVGSYAFYHLQSLKTVTFADTVVSLGHNAFDVCTSLEELELPPELSTLGEMAFANCLSIRTLTVPGTVDTVSKGAFEHCVSLETVYISEGVAVIGGEAFGQCKAIWYMTLPSTLSYVDKTAFNGRTLVDLDGKTVLEQNASNLAGWTFMERNGIFARIVPEIVTFMVGDEVYYSEIYSKGETIILPEDPVVEIPYGYSEYSFVGWEGYTEGMTVSSDVVFTAVFHIVPIPFTVTFVFSNMGLSHIVDYGSIVELPEIVPTKKAVDGIEYVFVGWEGYTEGMTVTGDMVFTAMFEEKPTDTHTVTIVYNDGTVEKVDVSKEEVISEPRFVLGYYKDAGHTQVWNPATRIHMDLTVYAISTVSGSAGGDTRWDIDFSTGTLTVSGTGATDDWSAKTAPWYSYRDSITGLVVEEGITYLGNHACYRFPHLTDIELSDTLVGIGKYCIVTSVAEHIAIGSSLDTIGVRGLFGMSFHEGERQVGIKDFNLRAKEFHGTDGVLHLSNIDGTASEVEWTIDYGTKTLTVYGNGSAGNWKATAAPWYAYRGYFENVVVGNGVTEIGDYSFYRYTGIKSIVLGDDVVRIGTNSLRGCISLEEISFDTGLTTIGSNALTGYTFVSDTGKTLKPTVANMAGHTFTGSGDRTFVRS